MRKTKLLTILALLLMAVTGAWAQETYTVTVKEGTADADQWTAKVGTGDAQALPIEGLEGGEAITLTYAGQKKVIGVTAAKKVDPLTIPLTMEALTAGTITITAPKEGMQYSLNGGAKTAFATTEDINLEVQAGDKVQFYGNGTAISKYLNTVILGSGDDFTCKVYGNIMSLIDETDFVTNKTLTEKNAFDGLFYKNTALVDASDLQLPAETLTESCYRKMFRECSNLVTVPNLPATTLAKNCYYRMFRDCTSLTAAPELPAPTLEENCYYEMFTGCSNLASVKCLATNPSNDTNGNWLQNAGNQVTGTKTFYAVSTTEWATNSDSGIPSGWERVNIDN